METPTENSPDDKLARLSAELAANPFLPDWIQATIEIRKRLDLLDEQELEREIEAERAN